MKLYIQTKQKDSHQDTGKTCQHLWLPQTIGHWLFLSPQGHTPLEKFVSEGLCTKHTNAKDNIPVGKSGIILWKCLLLGKATYKDFTSRLYWTLSEYYFLARTGHTGSSPSVASGSQDPWSQNCFPDSRNVLPASLSAFLLPPRLSFTKIAKVGQWEGQMARQIYRASHWRVAKNKLCSPYCLTFVENSYFS